MQASAVLGEIMCASYSSSATGTLVAGRHRSYTALGRHPCPRPLAPSFLGTAPHTRYTQGAHCGAAVQTSFSALLPNPYGVGGVLARFAAMHVEHALPQALKYGRSIERPIRARQPRGELRQNFLRIPYLGREVVLLSPFFSP